MQENDTFSEHFAFFILNRPSKFLHNKFVFWWRSFLTRDCKNWCHSTPKFRWRLHEKV